MPTCTECKFDWPADQIDHGVCDQCFKYGRERSIEMSKAQRATTVSPQSWTPPKQVNPAENVIMSTSIDIPGRDIDATISLVATETAIGLNILKDIANNWRDFFGGRAKSSESALGVARAECLRALKIQAYEGGADAIIAVSISYTEISTSGSGGILVVAANGTAVKLSPTH